jgi:hypothetical protein
MYAKVDKEKYQKVTGNARSAILAGRFLASVTAQLLVSFDWMNLRELNYLTLGGGNFEIHGEFQRILLLPFQLKQFP